jgi:Tfp pilus assembly protein PilE
MKIKVLPEIHNDNSNSIEEKSVLTKSATNEYKNSSNNIVNKKPLKENSSKLIEYKIFIGKNAKKYSDKFEKLKADDNISFKMTWHWPSFFFPWVWMLYRKMYLWALLTFFIDSILILNIIARFAIASTANYFYLQHVDKKIRLLKTQYPNMSKTDFFDILKNRGGTNKNLVYVFVTIFVVSVISAVAIPNFVAYSEKEERFTQQNTLNNLITYQKLYYTKFGSYAKNYDELSSIINNINDSVHFESVYSDDDNYILVASINDSKDRYLINGKKESITSMPYSPILLNAKENNDHMNTLIFDELYSRGYHVNELKLIGIVDMKQGDFINCYEINTDKGDGAYFFSPTAMHYVHFNTDEDMILFNEFLSMNVPGKRKFLKDQFTVTAGYSF